MSNLEQLKAERDALNAKIEQAIAAQRGEAIRQAKKLVVEFNLTARDLGLSGIGGVARRAGDARARVAPKYRDPNNFENTWTGRGKMPRWLNDAVQSGKSKESFLIGA